MGKLLFFKGFVSFVVLFVLGVRIHHKDKLPQKGPAILVANHNSHLDTMVLMTLFNRQMLPKIRPVAAADYFITSPFMKWFSTHIIGIIPIFRYKKGRTSREHPLEPCSTPLEQGDILILYPEGSRGNPEEMQDLKGGIAYLAKQYKKIPVIPIYMKGLGKALPKGDAVLVPFICDVIIGDAIHYKRSKNAFMQQLDKSFKQLAHSVS